MAIRIFTQPDENARLTDDLFRYIRHQTEHYKCNPRNFSYYRWQLADDGHMTLTHPRWAGLAYFAVKSYPGSGMVTLEIQSAPNTILEEKTYRRYHEEMMDWIYAYFPRRFYLVELTHIDWRGPRIRRLDPPYHIW